MAHTHYEQSSTTLSFFSGESILQTLLTKCEVLSLADATCDDLLHQILSSLKKPLLHVHSEQHPAMPKYTGDTNTSTNTNNFSAISNAMESMEKHTHHLKINASRYMNRNMQSFGLVVIPNRNAAMCIIPKSGCTALKSIISALLGFNPSDMCKWYEDMEYDFASFHASFEMILPLLNGRLIDEMLHSAAINKDANKTGDTKSLLLDVFGSRKFKSIAFVRDPWPRAISAFHQDLILFNATLKRLMEQNATHYITDLQDAFFQYHSSDDVTYLHGIPQTHFCGLSDLKYDHYLGMEGAWRELPVILDQVRLDLDLDEYNGAPTTATATATATEVLSTGWEKCTKGNKSSILGSSLKSPHVSAHSFHFWNKIYCTAKNVAQVMLRYKADYKLLGPIMHYSAPICPT